MAITESGLYVQNFVDMMDATQLAFNYISDAMNCALGDNTPTPNFTPNPASSDISAAEVSGTGQTGKVALVPTPVLSCGTPAPSQGSAPATSPTAGVSW